MRAADLDRIDLALSNVALGKERRRALDRRRARRRDPARRRATRPWLGVAVTDAQLIADIAAGYDVVVMGADKWAQVRDPAWYGGDAAARDAALASLPRVLVAPRPGLRRRRRRGARRRSRARARLVDPRPVRRASPRRARRAARGSLVDGNNVIGSRPDGWWRDRPGAARRLVAELQALAARTGDHITVVFDGRPAPGPRRRRARRRARRLRPARGARRRRRPHRRGDRARRRPVVAHRRHVGSGARATGTRARAPRSRARARSLASWDRNARDVVVALDAERVQRHRHQVVLADREHEVEQALRVVARRERGVGRVRQTSGRRAARRRRAAAPRRPPTSRRRRDPAATRAISSSVMPMPRAIATCWPHSYGARQFQPVRRIEELAVARPAACSSRARDCRTRASAS